jgi:hypothetical protein
MMGRSMSKGGIRITASPSQNGSTVNDEIPGSNEPSSDGRENREHEKRLVHRGTSSVSTFTLLRWAWDAWLPIFAQWQATSQSQSRPTLQPVVHILIG